MQAATPHHDAVRDSRVARSRAVILAAATRHFQQTGYVGASVDDIAAAAQVSKRTIYNIFGGKEQLFRETLSAALDIAERFSAEAAGVLADSDDVTADLRAVACRLARAVLGGPVVALRRLVISEAERFPDIAREYYDRAPGLVMDTLAEAMRRLGERGRLDVDDPRRASEHFAFLIMGAPLDRALFAPAGETPPDEEIDAYARHGVDVFLRAYGAGAAG